MHGHEPLQRSRRSVALHGSLPFSKRQVAILGSVIKAFVRPMNEAGSYICLCCTIGAQFVGDDPFWSKAIAHHQCYKRRLAAILLRRFCSISSRTVPY